MTAPFYRAGLFGEEVGLLVALVIGLGFGFFLERAGLASARKLVAQFYLTDLAVFKVMFTAIITAMIGLALLSSAGLLDREQLYLVPTYWAPQIVGGLLLGAGFLIGGYCPGTSIAAFATGRIDGLVCVLGIVVGTLTFALLFPWLQVLYLAGRAGELTLPQFLGLPYRLVVSGVVVLALCGFYGASLIERRFSAPTQGSPQ